MKTNFRFVEDILNDLKDNKSIFYDSESLSEKIDDFILSLLIIKEEGRNIPSKLHLVKSSREMSYFPNIRTTKFLLDVFVELNFVIGNKSLIIYNSIDYIDSNIVLNMVKNKMGYTQFMRLRKIKTIQNKLNA